MNDTLCETLKQQAQIWKQEARTQAATVRDCYQACTGSTGEPGDWNGAAPIRAALNAKDAEIERLRAELSVTHRALMLELQQHKRSHAEVLRLAVRLRKYEPGQPMHLA